jgi:hypothetical protein
MGLRCARKVASFAAFSSFDHGHDGGFPQVMGPFASLGQQIVRLLILDELLFSVPPAGAWIET